MGLEPADLGVGWAGGGGGGAGVRTYISASVTMRKLDDILLTRF